MIEEIEAEAASLLAAGDYEQALAEFSVLREIRSRREGPYSVRYLSDLHNCVRCMSHLELWADSMPLCSELHGKYVNTHGPGEADTVDVAKHWAWALVHLHDYPPAVRLWLMTADALWDVDPDQARRLLGAAVVHRGDAPAGPSTGQTLIDGAQLAHSRDVLDAIDAVLATNPDPLTARASVTIDGLALA
ncbi:hypothetical protein [Gordonia soli]|uniref:hypothetical protein n=1 Tax=Gordonia soli TaxID=320799 RepID=UPI00058EEA8A|nr:hypothetical protein [Gordonia soli]